MDLTLIIFYHKRVSRKIFKGEVGNARKTLGNGQSIRKPKQIRGLGI